MQRINLKDAFVRELIALAEKDPRILVLDPEVARSTKMLRFRDAFPNRFIELGVAEQNVMGVAAGLAAEGFVPFAVAFSVFLTLRPFEIIRCAICHGKKNVKLIAHYSGLSDGKDGPTHMSMEDLGAMRSIPQVVILTPSDPVTTARLLHPLMAHDGPVYMRIENEDLPPLYPSDMSFSIGETRRLRQGADLTIISQGSGVHRALAAAAELEAQGVEAEVLDALSLKPFDRETLLRSAEKTRRVLSVEDHNIHGGLASAVSETLAQSGCGALHRPLAVWEIFPESGKPDTLREKYGTSCAHILKAAGEVLAK